MVHRRKPRRTASKPRQTDGIINPSADAVNILRIEIEDIEPLIWWRVAVRSSTNLKDLHKVIQVAMGWVDSQRALRRIQ
jgi:Plasmid pRiA4b ORF-3-like protein